MKKYALSELVLDFDLYPRGGVDSHHVTEIAAAIEAGTSVPPIVIDKASKRIVDGVHRWKAQRRLFGEDHKADCIEKTYKSDGEMFLDAMRYNASHGRALTQHGKTHCLILAKRFEIPEEMVGQALNLTPARIGTLTAGRIGKIGAQPVALKQTIRHMAGKRLNPIQAKANEKLSGMNQLFYVNQIITLLESDLIDTENGELLEGLSRLSGLLETFLRKAA